MTATDKIICKNTETLLLRDGLVVSVSASHAVGRGFASRSGHTEDHHKNDTNCLPSWYTCVRVGV